MSKEMLEALTKLGAVTEDAAKRMNMDVMDLLVTFPKENLIAELVGGMAKLHFVLPDNSAMGEFVVTRSVGETVHISPANPRWGIRW